ncbi:hypothetical protein CTAYLR_003684 [Chrysophaeum taylorii]|uniref:Uncharacterized protein n=1 Tax=Chrysophaeum taylorii TaxID=2483200 RepID=A0AAD7XK19_9STRA|nr:hypothetical protein CTAYLR_003684 [Chrysophaeum taylorii]
MAFLVARYLEALRRRPLETNCASAMVVTSCGDVISQILERREWDAVRTAKLSLWGAVWMGPSSTLWFRWLERFGGGARGLAIKVALNQSTMAPLTNGLFYLYSELWGPFATLRQRYSTRMTNEFAATMLASVSVWVPTQTFNFAVVPPFLRPLFLNVAFVLWTAHLSYRGHKTYDCDADSEPQ